MLLTIKLVDIEEILIQKILIKQLNENTSLPVISAGGVASKSDIDKMMSYGAVGVSVGSPFIASKKLEFLMNTNKLVLIMVQKTL